jgi:hypothetical protein
LIYEEPAKQLKKLSKESAENKRMRQLLCKRTKELNCLYAVLEILNRSGISLKERLQQIVASLPQGWQYPEITCARLVFEGQVYTSSPFESGPCSQVADIVVGGNKLGAIEVYYKKEKTVRDEGPFLKEERDLIDAIATRISTFIERRRAEEARQKAEKRLHEALTKMLGGFIPICSNCKKVRDNASEWVEIETYIRDHSEAEFSHSICPQCLRKLYPDLKNTK